MTATSMPIQASTPIVLPAAALVDQRQLIAAHRAISALEHALRFSPASASAAFRDMVWLLDGLGAMQLDGEPVWLQTVIDEPTHPAVQRAQRYASIAATLARSAGGVQVSQTMALQIAEELSADAPLAQVSLRRDANPNEALQHGLAHWEHVVSDAGGDSDSLVMAAIADAKFRRLSPFSSNNHASAGLLLGVVLAEEQLLTETPMCLSHYFSCNSLAFNRALTRDDTVVRFFLRALTETALDLIERLSLLVNHIEHCRQVIDQTLSRAPVELVLAVVCRPVCTNTDLMEAGVSRRQTSASYLKKLAAAGILSSHPKGKELRYVNPGVIEAFSALS